MKHTFVDSVFGGYFISTVLCEECHMVSASLTITVYLNSDVHLVPSNTPVCSLRLVFFFHAYFQTLCKLPSLDNLVCAKF